MRALCGTLSALTIAVAALASAPAAIADSTTSSNWSGYAAHGKGAHFRKISAAWIQPSASCTPGQPTYSAIWVGLGGYSQSSQALEQVGTELDCSASGQLESTAWYELVPAGSVTIRHTVAPGDLVRAAVTVSGHRVRMSITDATSGWSFVKTTQATTVDTSSAEWIVEAPSECTSSNSCQTLPLADFGSAEFAYAKAQLRSGHSGAIADRRWRTTRISLVPHGRRFVGFTGTGGAGAEATPGALTSGNTSFTVTYSSPQANDTTNAATRDGSLIHERQA
jgi:Peptidase A4 family